MAYTHTHTHTHTRMPKRDRDSVPEDEETAIMPEELWMKVHNIVQDQNQPRYR